MGNFTSLVTLDLSHLQELEGIIGDIGQLDFVGYVGLESLRELEGITGNIGQHMDDNISLHQKLFNQMLDLRLVELISQGHCTYSAKKGNV